MPSHIRSYKKELRGDPFDPFLAHLYHASKKSLSLSMTHWIRLFQDVYRPRTDTHWGRDVSYHKDHMQCIQWKETGALTEIRSYRSMDIFASADFVAWHIVSQLEQNKSFRLIWKQLMQDLTTKSQRARTIQGFRVVCAGRIAGAEMAREESRKWGQTSLHVFSRKIDYSAQAAHTVFGLIGVKVWIWYTI
jgi:hypothetical protein